MAGRGRLGGGKGVGERLSSERHSDSCINVIWVSYCWGNVRPPPEGAPGRPSVRVRAYRGGLPRPVRQGPPSGSGKPGSPGPAQGVGGAGQPGRGVHSPGSRPGPFLVGALPLVAPLLDRLDVVGIVDRACPMRGRAALTHGEVVAALVANRLTVPVSAL